MIPQSIKDAIDEYRIAIFDSSTPSHARKRLEDAIEAALLPPAITHPRPIVLDGYDDY